MGISHTPLNTLSDIMATVGGHHTQPIQQQAVAGGTTATIATVPNESSLASSLERRRQVRMTSAIGVCCIHSFHHLSIDI
jgi:hypothetical protein